MGGRRPPFAGLATRKDTRRLLRHLLTLLVFVTLMTVSDAGRAQSLADLVAAARSSEATAPSGAGLFGSHEFRSGSLRALPQWLSVLRRFRGDRTRFAQCGAEDGCSSHDFRAWHEIIASARHLGEREKLHAVNRYFNRWPHRNDTEAYGLREYWATPSEFLVKSGDCEDYSIAKFFALRQLGFAPERLRVVILLDRIRNIGHAVLAVQMESDILILDSLSDLIVSHRKYKHYVPQYSMNETTRWAHVNGSDAMPSASSSRAVAQQQ